MDNTVKRSWMIRGLIFGLLMFVFMELAYPVLWEEGIDPSELIIKGVVWLCVGLLWGFLMRYSVR